MPRLDTSFAKAALLLSIAGLCWAGTHVVGRAMAGHVPPFGTSFVRWAVPILILLPFVWSHLKRDAPLIRRHFWLLAAFGLPGGPVFAGLQYTGLQYTEALNASIMNSISPVLVAAAGALIFRDRLGWRQVVGIATSLVGVLIVVCRGDLDILRTLAFNGGDLFLLANQASWAVYSTFLRLKPAIHWLTFLFLICVFSSIGVLPLWLWEMSTGYHFQATPLTAVALAYMAIFPGMVAFACFNRATELIGAIRAAPFTHLIPVFGAVLAYALLGEMMAAFHVVGFVTILSGIWLATRKP